MIKDGKGGALYAIVHQNRSGSRTRTRVTQIHFYIIIYSAHCELYRDSHVPNFHIKDIKELKGSILHRLIDLGAIFIIDCCWLYFSWSPNSTCLHLDFYLLSWWWQLGLAMWMYLPMRIDAHHPHIVQKESSHFWPINCNFDSVFPNPWAQRPSWPMYCAPMGFLLVRFPDPFVRP